MVPRDVLSLVAFAVWAMLLVASGVAAGERDDLATRARESVPQVQGRLQVKGLRAPVEVLRDRWGVAHIRARNQHDLFFAQG